MESNKKKLIKQTYMKKNHIKYYKNHSYGYIEAFLLTKDMENLYIYILFLKSRNYENENERIYDSKNNINDYILWIEKLTMFSS